MLSRNTPELKAPEMLETQFASGRYIDAYAPNESIDRLLDLDIEAHVAEGRTNLVIDAEGTFVQYDGWKVDEEIIDWFSTLRSRGIERVIITTNKAANDEASLVQMQAWAEQVGADALISPMNPAQRKPSPYMLLAAIQEFDLATETMLSVGDKLHGDVLAANLAGVHSVFLTKPHGKAEHPGDKFLKRPLIERPIYRAVKNREPKVRFTPKYDNFEEVTDKAGINPKGLIIDPYITESGRLVGYAIDPIVLSKEFRAKLPPPQFARLRNLSDTAANAIKNFQPISDYAEYLREYGEDHAEWLTEKRKTVLAPTIGVLALAGGIAEVMKHKKAARVLRTAGLITYFASHATDGLDGLAIRMSKADLKSQRRIEGAEEDRIADQEVSNATGYGLVLGLKKDPANQYLQSLRVKLRRKQTKKWTSAGYDTKSDRVSKIANEFQGIADTLSFKSGLSRKAIASQLIATSLKYASMINSEKRVWPYRKARLEAAQEVLEQLKS